MWAFLASYCLDVFVSYSKAVQTLFMTLLPWECQPAQEEVKKKELTKEDIDMKFDISMTKHKGQVLFFDYTGS